MDGAVVCLSLAVNMARFDNFVITIIKLNLSVFFFFYVQNEMLCTNQIIDFSLGNSFSIVMDARARQHYSNTVPSDERTFA
jgi:hypothetical protein